MESLTLRNAPPNEQAPAETCDRNRKFEKQLELAGPSMASMVKQLKQTLSEHC